MTPFSQVRRPAARSTARRSAASPLLPFLTLLAAFVIACGGGTGPNGGGGGGGGGGGIGTFTAVVDGAPWASAAVGLTATSSAAAQGFLVVSGIQFAGTDYTAVQLYLGFIGATGTYPLGVNQGSTPGGSGGVLVKAGASVTNWLSKFSGAEGTVTITKLTSTEIAGTFQYTAQDLLNAAPDKTITSGAFDVALPATFHVPVADEYGNTITADLNGTPWIGATVVGVGDLSVGVFSMGGSTTGISVNLLNSVPVVAGNTYDQTEVTVGASGSGVNCCWGGPGTVSSVTINTLTATRVAGTFTGNLPVTGGGGAPGPLVITNGAFDIRIP